MLCSEIRPLLADFVESNVTEEQAGDVREHVRVCAACGAELKALADVGVLLMEWQPPALPATVWKRLEAQLPAPQRPKPLLHAPAFRVAFAVSVTILTGLLLWALAVRPALRAHWSGTEASQQENAQTFGGTPAFPVPATTPVVDEPPPSETGTNHVEPPDVKELHPVPAKPSGIPTAIPVTVKDPDRPAPPTDKPRAVQPSRTPTGKRSATGGRSPVKEGGPAAPRETP